ncbi:hypothetical protein, partial [Butyrivibrio hungatei]|uniref:hypothetical protein n=1 Tax=Butyrivibrio hungatei TaxID=185008 RepID=UPI000552317B
LIIRISFWFVIGNCHLGAIWLPFGLLLGTFGDVFVNNQNDKKTFNQSLIIFGTGIITLFDKI